MTSYYVATLGAYVLVDAKNEAEARETGQPALEALYAEVRKERPDAPVVVRTVRPATDDEIQLWQWHQEAMAGDQGGS